MKDLLDEFFHVPSDQPTHQIQVVCLHPRRWLIDRIIICDIKIVNTETAPEHESLSYELGSSSSSESEQYTIQLIQGFFAVRKNLYWALFNLRHSQQIRTLWIDALCIDKTDILERNCQVSMIGEIYSQASTVVAWVRNHDGESRQARIILSELFSVSPEKYCDSDYNCWAKQHSVGYVIGVTGLVFLV